MEDCLALNRVGLTTITISKIFNVNQSAVSAKLRKAGVACTYPRRQSKGFMEDVFFNLSAQEQEYLSEQCRKTPIKEYLASLIKKDYAEAEGNSKPSNELPPWK